MIFEIPINGRDIGLKMLTFSDIKHLVLGGTSSSRQVVELIDKHILDEVNTSESLLAFIHLLANSLGETSLPLTSSEGQFKGILKTSDIVLSEAKSNIIKVNDSVVLNMVQPSVSTLLKNNKTTARGMFNLVSEAISTVTQDNVEHLVDPVELLSTVSSTVYGELTQYILSLPDLSVVVNMSGEVDGKKVVEDHTIVGFQAIYDLFIGRLDANVLYQTNHLFTQNNYSYNSIGNMLPFERDIYVGQIIQQLKEQQEQMTNS